MALAVNAAAGPAGENGTGVQILSGVNTYTGATTITGGTLSIGSGGSLGNTAVTVEANGTLAGIGSIAGFTTIEGFHAPGMSPGIQTFSGGLTYASSSTLTWELIDNVAGVRGTDFDGVDVTGGVFSLESGATIDLSFGSSVDFLNSFWGTDQSWLVVDLGSGVTGDGGTEVFSIGTISGGNNYSPALGSFGVSRLADGDDKNDVVLTWTAIPEPSSLLLAVLGIFPLLARRRRD
jgi:autotransporter-associated beta strand protein